MDDDDDDNNEEDDEVDLDIVPQKPKESLHLIDQLMRAPLTDEEISCLSSLSDRLQKQVLKEKQQQSILGYFSTVKPGTE